MFILIFIFCTCDPLLHIKIFRIPQGHGEYTEITEEKEFFETTKKSENVVCHFYRDQFLRCKIVDKHLDILAKKHIETKFCKLNVEKAPFLTGKYEFLVFHIFYYSVL